MFLLAPYLINDTRYRTVIKSIAIAALSARVVYFRATAGAIRAMKDAVNLHFPAQALVAGILRSCLCQSPRIALHSHSTSTTLNDKSGRTAELCKCSLSLSKQVKVGKWARDRRHSAPSLPRGPASRSPARAQLGAGVGCRDPQPYGSRQLLVSWPARARFGHLWDRNRHKKSAFVCLFVCLFIFVASLSALLLLLLLLLVASNLGGSRTSSNNL